MVKGSPYAAFEVARNIEDATRFLIISLNRQRAQALEVMLRAQQSTVSYQGDKIATQDKSRKFKSVIVPSGLLGLKICQTEAFDMIICDYATKFMTGWQFVRQFKNQIELPNLPIVLFSANPAQVKEDLIQKKSLMQEYGIKDILTYPCKSVGLEKIINDTLGLFHNAEKTEYQYTIAKQAFNNDDIEKSAQQFQAIYKQNKTTGRANLGVAAICAAKKDLAQQNKFLDQASQYDKENLAVVFQTFESAVTAQDMPQIESLAATLISPKQADNAVLFAYRFCQILLKHKMFQQAIDLIDQKQELLVPVPRFLSLILGRCYYHLDDIQQAQDVMEKMVTGHDGEVEALNLLAIIYRKKNETRLSIETFFKALEKSPTDYRIIFNIALGYGHLQDFFKSEAYAKKVIKMAPAYTKAQQYLKNLEKIKSKKNSK